MSRSSTSPPSGHRVVTTPFLSELIENKKKRSLEIENDYTEHPNLSTSRLPLTAASDADVMRRAFSYARSLPGQLDLERCKTSPSAGAGVGVGALPPPIPPRPVKSLSCNERRHFVGDDLILVARSPPPRPPKSADVIALMMSPNDPRRLRRHHPPPPLLHPSLRDRRGDAIETSQLRHHRRHHHHRSHTAPVVSQPRRKHATPTSPSGEKKEQRRKCDDDDEDDDIAREKRRLRERKATMTSSPPPSCPHCGKCITEESDVTKNHRGEADEIDIEKGLIRKRMIEEEEEEGGRGAMRRWDCSARCCVEAVTCMSCVRCCFYHCNKDDNGANLWADKPCACHGVGCRSRWCHLVALSLCFPFIIFYPLARACTASLTTRQRRNNSNSNNHNNNKQQSEPADS